MFFNPHLPVALNNMPLDFGRALHASPHMWHDELFAQFLDE